ncbi:hypothetical protein H8718_14640 [Lachnospiraceae bacterium NSJ-12]|uniref:Glycosyl transferase family 28 C-terminal domain-containing protein n=2 Tax=Zhenhengia yiwuensis TaxID=2763666 RepID=A0A926EJC7_9FIRM|nr:glycosyltransferase [Zhenhengia yiwuensis]MBC8580756.1 hypothetical protein [Zhenhengia yiwuensis]
MANIIIFSFPYYGHVNYLTKVAKMLSKENQVYMDIDKKYSYMLEGTNVHILETKFQGDTKTEDVGLKKQLESVFYFADGLLACAESYLRDMDYIKKLEPDCIILDSMAYWGKKIAVNLQVPYISSVTMQPIGKEDFSKDLKLVLQGYIGDTSISEKSLKREIRMYEVILQKKYQDEAFYILDCICANGMLNILYTAPELIYYKNAQENSCLFLGILLPEKTKMGNRTKEKGIYISFGTILRLKELIVKCIDGVKDLACTVYVSAGEYEEELRNKYKSYPNINIGKFLKQLDLIEKCSLCICHGGQNTVMESLYYEVPLLIIPQVNDEFINAEFVKERGYGEKILSKEVTSELIKKKSIEIMESRDIKEKVGNASKQLRVYSNQEYRMKQEELCKAVKLLLNKERR